MKKALMVLGVVFLVLLVLAGVGITYAVNRSTTLGKEAKVYVDAAVPAIFSGWNEQELINRASPELMEVMKGEGLKKLFSLRNRIGTFQSYGGSQDGSITIFSKAGFTHAIVTADAKFDTGPATIKMTLVKRNAWQIIGLKVSSKALL